MLNLAICDNEPAIIEELEEYLDKISDISFDYEVFFSAEELYSYKKNRNWILIVISWILKWERCLDWNLLKNYGKTLPIPLSFFLQVFLNMFMMFLKL